MGVKMVAIDGDKVIGDWLARGDNSARALKLLSDESNDDTDLSMWLAEEMEKDLPAWAQTAIMGIVHSTDMRDVHSILARHAAKLYGDDFDDEDDLDD